MSYCFHYAAGHPYRGSHPLYSGTPGVVSHRPASTLVDRRPRRPSPLSFQEPVMTRTRRPRPTSSPSHSDAVAAAREALQEALDRRSR